MRRHLCRLVFFDTDNTNDEGEIEVLGFDFGFTDDEVVLLIED